MIDAEQVASELASTDGVDEYIVSSKQLQGWRRRLGEGSVQEQVTRTQIESQIFADRRQGRGQSQVQITEDRPLAEQVRDASSRALAAMGPAWQLRPPSAAARVPVSDPDWQGPPKQIVDRALEAFISHLPGKLQAQEFELGFSREDLRVITSNGFDKSYRRTLLSARALLRAATGHVVPLQLHARQGSDLRWQESMAWAARLAQDYQQAGAMPNSECDVVLLAQAYSPERVTDFGLWTPLVQQCSAERFRSGVARYGLGQSISKGLRGEALSMSSDGTLPYGLQSAPLGWDGQPVRRFPMVDKGVAAGQAVDHREAALGNTTANGGVRNLRIAGGSQSLEQLLAPGQRPLLVVDRLSKLMSEPRGRVALEIDRATWHRQDGQERSVGGLISGNLFQWLEDAYYSSEMHETPWSQTPRAIRFNGLRVQA